MPLTQPSGAGAAVTKTSLVFDGVSDYVTCGAGVYNFERTDTFSIEFWHRKGLVSNSGMLIANTLAGSNRGYWIQSNATSGRIRVFLRNTATTNEIQITSSISITVGTWAHVVVTYAGTSLASGFKMYINGVLDSSPTVDTDLLSATTVDAASVLQFGARQGSTFYSGNIGRGSISSGKIFSQAEVTELYNSGAYFDITTFSAYSTVSSAWLMGEGSTQPTINDIKGSVHGTMTSMGAWNIVSSYPGSTY